MEEENQPSQVNSVVRWIAFLPVALIAAWISWFLLVLINRVTVAGVGLDPNSFLSRIYIEFIAHAAMGAAFVYVGFRIAPLHKRTVVLFLAGTGVLAAGFLLYPAIMVNDPWAIWGGISLIMGLGASAYSIDSTGQMQ